MTVRTMTLAEIRAKGIAALVRELGPTGAIRFLQEYEHGSGDYTGERYTWLPRRDVRALAEEIRAGRA